MKISIVIITKDEEKMIGDCLHTLVWSDEIIVIDTGSKDNTNKIAKKYNAKIVEYKSGKNFSDWRNKGIKEAKGAWILYIDADERIPVSLKDEILKVINNESSLNAYAIPRRNFMFGQEMKHIAVPPDYQKRLFRKKYLKNWIGEVHEEPVFDGNLGYLKNAMIHEKHESFSEMVEKTNKWSNIEAALMYKANHPPMNIPRFLSAMGREFWQRMVVHKAFLDGKIGIMYAFYQVFSRFTSYAKLWEMQLKNESSNL